MIDADALQARIARLGEVALELHQDAMRFRRNDAPMARQERFDVAAKLEDAAEGAGRAREVLAQVLDRLAKKKG